MVYLQDYGWHVCVYVFLLQLTFTCPAARCQLPWI